MKIKISRIFIWLAVLSVFGSAGYLIYINSQAPAVPQSFASEVLEETEAQSDDKVRVCTYSFYAIEYREQVRIISGEDEISFGNFPPKKVIITDTVTYSDFYFVPVKQVMTFPGNRQPTLAQAATMYEPYLEGGKLFKWEHLRRERCDLKEPIDTKD